MNRRERLFVVVGGVLVLAGAVVVSRLSFDVPPIPGPKRAVWLPGPEVSSEDGALFASVEHMRQIGEPTTLQELCERGEPVRGAWDNAADFMTYHPLDESVDEVVDPDAKPRFWPWDGASSADRETGESLAQLELLVPRLYKVQDDMTRALGCVRCRFRFNRGEFGAADHREFRLKRRAQSALAAIAVASKEPWRRLNACWALIRFGRIDEPCGGLELMADDALMCSGIEAARYEIERQALNAADLRPWLDPLLARSTFDRLPRVLLGERVQWIDMYRYVKGVEKDASERAKAAAITADGCAAIRSIEDVRTTPLAQFVGHVTDIAKREGHGTLALIHVVKQLGQTDAACRLARIALAAAEHREKHGDFPASLVELQPVFAYDMPVDPYADARFVYSKTAAGVRIASVGRLPEDPPLDDATLRDRCLVWELKR